MTQQHQLGGYLCIYGHEYGYELKCLKFGMAQSAGRYTPGHGSITPQATIGSAGCTPRNQEQRYGKIETRDVDLLTYRCVHTVGICLAVVMSTGNKKSVGKPEQSTFSKFEPEKKWSASNPPERRPQLAGRRTRAKNRKYNLLSPPTP